MKVNIAMITYNHEAYIERAIQSVIRQRCEFDFQLVIGDDASTDLTRSIASRYADQYPDKVKLLEATENLGMQRNFLRVFQACRHSEYVAMLEGDDFWIDEEKLQTQLEFMERNDDFAICFHPVQVITDSEEEPIVITNQGQKEITDLYDLCQGNYIYTSSCFFRNLMQDQLPDWYGEALVGDFPLHLMTARYGKIKFISKPMSIYRVHAGGAFSSYRQWNLSKRKHKARKMAELYENLIREFPDDARIERSLQRLKIADLNALRLLFIEERNREMTKDLSFDILKNIKNGAPASLRLLASCLMSYIYPSFYFTKKSLVE